MENDLTARSHALSRISPSELETGLHAEGVAERGMLLGPHCDAVREVVDTHVAALELLSSAEGVPAVPAIPPDHRSMFQGVILEEYLSRPSCQREDQWCANEKRDCLEQFDAAPVGVIDYQHSGDGSGMDADAQHSASDDAVGLAVRCTLGLESQYTGTEARGLSYNDTTDSGADSTSLDENDTDDDGVATALKEVQTDGKLSDCQRPVYRNQPAPTKGALPKQQLHKQGWLSKRGGGRLSLGRHQGQFFARENWKQRWFSLHGGVLRYFKKPYEATSNALGAVRLRGCSIARRDTLSFAILSPKRTYNIMAANDALATEWVMLLREAAISDPEATTT